jgi:hypothetical protein
MKLEATENSYLDLDFEVAQPGVSILQFTEGVQKRTNEKSGKTTLQLPMIIDTVLAGPESNIGLTMSHFVPIETPFGERQLAGILTMTGLVEPFSKKFGSEVDITDDSFVNAVKLKLPGKFIQVTHEIRKDNSGKDRVSITRMEAVAKSGKQAAKPGKPSSVKADDAGGDDW